MITINGMREKFEFYRKWLSTLLNKEFMNLPYKEQDKFLGMIKGFLDNCERVHKEAKLIKEKTVEIKVKSIEINDSGSYTIVGTSLDLPDLRIKYPLSNPLPVVGSSLNCIIFSVDEDFWYSSKEELITGR
jgi:hypothetical protein